VSEAHSETIAADMSPQFHTAHHFDSADTQFDAGKLGVWLFLVTEVLLFGGLFCAFAIFRNWYLPAFVEAHHKLNWKLGSVNTLFLITSSLTMALGVRAAQTNKKKLSALMMGATLMFAFGFLCIKYVEYSEKFREGLLPGKFFTAEGFHHRESALYFSLYFLMTGVHGLHVIIGMSLIVWVLIRTLRNEFSPRYYAPVEGVGLYWHLVDLIWIYLFPLLYLIS
jgi:cytochrome c oxidase subunit 3